MIVIEEGERRSWLPIILDRVTVDGEVEIEGPTLLILKPVEGRRRIGGPAKRISFLANS